MEPIMFFYPINKDQSDRKYRNSRALKASSPQPGADKAEFLQYVTENGLGLRFVSKELQQDEAIVLAAMYENFHALQCASPDLLEDGEFMLKAIRYKAEAYQYASEELKDDPDFQRAAAAMNGLSLHFITVTQRDVAVNKAPRMSKETLEQHSLYAHGRSSPDQPYAEDFFLGAPSNTP
jgi:hypothetical protein